MHAAAKWVITLRFTSRRSIPVFGSDAYMGRTPTNEVCCTMAVTGSEVIQGRRQMTR